MRRRAMPRRMGRPGLLGSVARTAVVAGTATAVAGGVRHRQESKYDEQDQQQAAQDQQAAPVPAQQGAPMAESDRMDRIKQLGEMKDQGLLTDDEFASEKARILAT
jgi:hypothetical protein